MRVDAVQDVVNKLAGSMHMRMDYNSFSKGEKKLLIVEGQTDEKFIKGHLNDDVLCLVANKAFGINSRFNASESINHKNAIIQVIYGLSVIPAVIKCPKGSEDWKVFGMIDMDFDEDEKYTRTSKLFITDTHDLETLMISTDTDLFERIEDCAISHDDLKKAVFIAYQLGMMKQWLNPLRSDVPTDLLSSGREQVDYSSFVSKDYRVSLMELIKYLNSKSDKRLNATKEKKLFDRLYKDKSVKKMISKEGIWTKGIDTFDTEGDDDIWSIVNGHDILSLLKYLNETAALKFRNRSPYHLDREFEIAMIEAYDHEKFGQTLLCSKMVKENVVKG